MALARGKRLLFRHRRRAAPVAGGVAVAAAGTGLARRARLRRASRWGRAEKSTAGLAAVALVTVGAVFAGELLRAAERLRRGEGGEGLLETAEQATREAVAVAMEGYEASTSREAALFNLLSGFVISFAVVRLSAVGIRGGWWPLGNVRMGGRHIHHFVPGIVLAFVSGGLAVTTRNDDLRTTLAIPFGVGMGLTFDEAALLLELEDVYWTRQGLLSIQLSLGLSALLGATVLALRILRRGEEAVLVENLSTPA